jgi:hypothetical protein
MPGLSGMHNLFQKYVTRIAVGLSATSCSVAKRPKCHASRVGEDEHSSFVMRNRNSLMVRLADDAEAAPNRSSETVKIRHGLGFQHRRRYCDTLSPVPSFTAASKNEKVGLP